MFDNIHKFINYCLQNLENGELDQHERYNDEELAERLNDLVSTKM